MQRTIQQITQQLVDRLPENDQYYRLDELRSWNFPTFIIRRIKIELERNLAESMIIPKTDWANTQSDAVLDAWQKFVDAIRAEARLPASYGKTVIETAVADVVEMLVQPRKNIPQVIFGTEDELSADEIRDRLKAVVVYPHFGRLIPRYMQKKELDSLSRERCQKIITNADQKLTESYSPLNWAQMLEPLYKLVEGKIDTNLLRLFFEDKNLPRIARKFDLMNDKLSRAHFIEVLSSPDLLDFEGYEDEQSSLFKDQPSSSQTENSEQASSPTVEQEKERKPIDQTFYESVEAKQTTEVDPGLDQIDEKPTRSTEELEEGILNNNFTEPAEELSETESSSEVDEEDDGSLNAVFREEDKKSTEEQETTEKAEDSDEVASKDSSDGEEDEIENEKTIQEVEESDVVDESDHPKNGQEKASENDEGETPIWMRYMSDEELEEYEKEEEDQQEAGESDFIEEPIIDLTKEDTSEENIKALNKQLQGDRALFVEEIFRGSDRAFEEAVEEIASYDSWSDVSKYIEKDIFKRNLVDMYSEAAVDFTDQLQTYFLDKQNQNK